MDELSPEALHLDADAPGGLIDISGGDMTQEQLRTVGATVLAALG